MIASAGLRVPDYLQYTDEHQWVWEREGRARIGLTDRAQYLLKDIIGIDLPRAGETMVRNEAYALVETRKVAIEILAPISGTVLVVNAGVAENPRTVSNDPYGAGWLCLLKPCDRRELGSLLDARAYAALLASL